MNIVELGNFLDIGKLANFIHVDETVPEKVVDTITSTGQVFDFMLHQMIQ